MLEIIFSLYSILKEMPKRYGKKRYTKKKRVFRKKRIYRKKKAIGNFTKLGNNMTFPKSMMIKQNFNFSGYVAAGETSGFFDIGLNTALNPFDNTGNGWSTPTNFTDTSNNGVLLTGDTLTLVSQNYNELMAIYNNTKVIASKLSINITPQALTDSIKLFVTPFMASVDGSATNDTPTNDMTQAFAPRCRNKICVPNVGSSSKNTLSIAVSVAKLYGVSKRAVYDEDNYSENPTLTNQLNNCATYRVFWTTLDEVALATALPFQVRLTNITKFYGMENTYIQ